MSRRVPEDDLHKIFCYVLKIGDIEEASNIFLDLLEMKVISQEEFNMGSADGTDVHYDGPWSRTVIGYSSTILDPASSSPCLELAVNWGVEKYTRGNFLEGVELLVSSSIIDKLVDAGITSREWAGMDVYMLTCEGYNFHIVKSPDNSNRVSRVILNCSERLSLTGPTVNFWTRCLGFEISAWSSDPSRDHDAQLLDYLDNRYDTYFIPWCCRRCCCRSHIKARNAYKPLRKDEEPYVELQFGSSKNFSIRLQMLHKDLELELGSGREKVLITCSKQLLNSIEARIRTIGVLHGGSGSKKSFQLVPGKSDFTGVVATDSNGLELVYYNHENVMEAIEIQPDAEKKFREFIQRYKKEVESRKSRNSRGR